MTKRTVPSLIARKASGEKIVALTAYDYLFAKLLDESGIDLILVGDSCAMVVQGQESTLPFTMDEAIYHCKAVRRGVNRALLVGDMPFMSYQMDTSQAMINAGQFFKEALVDAVKLEGGQRVVPTIEKIVSAGMPVMGHLGLTPQSVKQFGGYGVQARNGEGARQLIQDALALQEAGVFALVLEKIPRELAATVTEKLDIPTIGIGAGPDCDGQILVTQDMLGLNQEFHPKFVRWYAELGEAVCTACQAYARDVRDGSFPAQHESYPASQKGSL
jgi:3-methyl-2-oxobutanoate hydroxymethyltransferase